MSTGTAVAFALALLPGVFSWWRGRKLLAQPQRDAEHLYPLLQRGATRATYQIALLSAAAIALTPHAVAVFGVGIVGLALGATPARRELTGERLGNLASAAAQLRVLLGLWGLPLLMIVGLAVAAQLGRHGLWVSVPVSALVVYGFLDTVRFSRVLLGARPIADAELEARFAELAEHADLDMPLQHFRIGHPQQCFANAYALASVHDYGIGIGDRLLEELEPDEAAAIYAHELAHLELWPSEQQRRQRAAAAFFLPLMVIGLPYGITVYGVHPGWVLIAVLFLAAAYLRALVALRGRESACDARAVELGADPEALIRALRKLGELSYLPERIPAATERASTHPSLAHRTLAIRRAARRDEPAEPWPLDFDLAGGAGRLHLEEGQLRWIEGGEDGDDAGGSEERILALDALLSLAVERTPEGDHLVAQAPSIPRGTRPPPVRIPILPEDVERIDRAVAGLELSGETPRPPWIVVEHRGPPWVGALLARVTALLLLLMGIVAPHVPAALSTVALVALLRPTRTWMLRIAGACILTLGLSYLWPAVAFADGYGNPGGTRLILMLFVILSAIVAILAPAGEDSSRLRAVAMGALGLTVVVASGTVVAAMGTPADAFAIHLVLRERPGAVIALVMLAVVGARGGAVARNLAVPALLVGLVWGALGLRATLAAVAADPFVIDAETEGVVEVEPGVRASFSLSGWDWGARIGPDGARWAHAREHEWAPAHFLLKHGEAQTEGIRAWDLRFVGDHQVVTLEREGEGTVLRLLECFPGSSKHREIAHRRVDPYDGESHEWHWLEASASGDGRFVLQGRHPAYREALQIEATTEHIRDPELPLALERWVLPAEVAYSESGWVIGPGANPLVVEHAHGHGLHDDHSPYPLGPVARFLFPHPEEQRVTLFGRGQWQTRLAVTTLAAPVAGAPQLLLASDGDRTHLWSVDPVEDRFDPQCVLPGSVHAVAHGLPGQLVLFTTHRELLRVHFGEGRCQVEEIGLPPGGWWLYDLAHSEAGVLGIGAHLGRPRLLRVDFERPAPVAPRRGAPGGQEAG